MAKLVSLPEIIQNIYVKLEESGSGGSGTGGNCSSNITIDASTNKGTLNISDGSSLVTQILKVNDTPKTGRVTLTDKDNNSISFDAVALTHLESNYYDKTTVDNKLSGLVLDSYDDTELKNRVTVLENKVDNDTIYDDTELSNRVTVLENKVDNDTIYDDTELSNRVTTLENIYEETVERVNSNESYKSTLEISYNLGQEGSLDYEDYNNRKYLFKNVNGSISFLENRIPGEPTSSFTISTNLTPPAGIAFSSINTEIPTKAYVDTEINSIKSQIQTISSQGYDDTELKNRVTILENKVSNMVTYADLTGAGLNEFVVSFPEDTQDINQLLATKIKGSPTTTLTIDDLNFVESYRQETENENYEHIVLIDYKAIVYTDITFKDGSSINNAKIDFYKRIEENLGSEYVYLPLENGVKIQRTNPDIPAYVDTGLTKNGNYTFIAEGYTTNGKVSVLIGSYGSNTDRTTARILGTSNKLQSMWSANNEITNAESGIDFNSFFTYEQKANSIDIYNSDGQTFTKTFTNHNTSQTTNTPIYLFNESTTGDYDHGVFYRASIRGITIGSEYDRNIRYFIPCKDTRTNEIVLIDVANYQPDSEPINKYSYLQFLKNGYIPEENIYRPTNGILVEA